MIQLTVNQFNLVETVFSFALSVLGIATAFFFLQRSEVAPRYRTLVTILGLVTMVASYNYFRLFESWNAAFVVTNGVVHSTGHLYDDTYRYADWLITVPLLLVALVQVLDMPARQARLRSSVLAMLAAEMIILGYPGQVATTVESRWLWWAISMVPFVLIVFQLFVGIAKTIDDQPAHARGLVIFARFLTVFVWCFYPIVYALPLLGVTGTSAFIATQVGYAAADLSAKAIYGVIIFVVAARKSNPVESAGADEPAAKLRSLLAKVS